MAKLMIKIKNMVSVQVYLRTASATKVCTRTIKWQEYHDYFLWEALKAFFFSVVTAKIPKDTTY